MEWKTIRSAYIKARGKRTQKEIAAAGGLYQSAISKLESNDKVGPAVGVFVKAVKGLGMTVSEFFALLERSEKSPLKPVTGTDENLPVTQPFIPGGAHGSPVSSSPPVYHLTDDDLIRIGRELGRAYADANKAHAPDRQDAGTRPRGPTRRAPRRRHS